jgi:hypothetical protein
MKHRFKSAWDFLLSKGIPVEIVDEAKEIAEKFMTIEDLLESRGIKVANGGEFDGATKGDLIIDSMDALRGLYLYLDEIAGARPNPTIWVNHKE